MNFSSLFGERVLAERSRLTLSQAQAGEICGVSREMWGKYERGKAVMGTEVLSRFAEAGADVTYILTGQRSQTTESNPRLAALVDNLDNMAEEDRRCIERLADSLSQQSRALKAVKNQ